MVHLNERRVFETAGQQAALIGSGKVDRPACHRHALAAQPGGSLFEQSIGGFLIVQAFEKTDEARFVAMKFVVVGIGESYYPTRHFALLPADPSLGLSIQKKGVAASGKQFFLFHQQRGRPMRVALVNAPGEAKKLLPFFFAGYFYNFQTMTD